MTVIIQAGHSSSYSSVLMENLHKHGLEKADKSYTHKLTHIEIVENLTKIQGKFSNMKGNSISDNIVTDFLLGNIDKKNWGWEAEKNLLLLDYWQTIEPDTSFLLVFDHPRYIFEKVEQSDLTLEYIANLVDEWLNYHQEMLYIHKKYKNKSFLIQGQFAIENMDYLIKELKGINWNLTEEKQELESLNIIPKQKNIDFENALLNELFRKYPNIEIVYESLINNMSIDNSFLKNDEKLYQLTDSLELVNFLRGNKTIKNDNITEQPTRLVHKFKDSKQYAEIKAINELLTVQLQSTQEELEKYYISNQVSASFQKAPNQSIGSEKVYLTGAAELIKQDLAYRIGSTMINHSKSAKSLAKLPAALFKEYRGFQITKADKDSLLNIEMYIDAHEADKTKKHLSYRIGKVLVDGFETPTSPIKIPFRMAKEIIDFKKK